MNKLLTSLMAITFIAGLGLSTSSMAAKHMGEATAKACKVEFDLRYNFANGALEALISPVFDRIANTFVDSFVKRAEQVYGAR